jgi:hypothetical protein
MPIWLSKAHHLLEAVMSHAVNFPEGTLFRGIVKNMRHAVALAVLLAGSGLTNGAMAAVGQPASRPGLIADESTFQAAARQQQQFDVAASRCEVSSVNEAVSLIYQYDDSPGALNIAQRCELQAITQGRADYKALASRIKALVAIKAKDMGALQSAGEALVASAQLPEFLADGHLFIAFACTFSGRAACARTHLEQAKLIFERHEVAGALEQLMSVEQALLKLEASSSSH